MVARDARAASTSSGSPSSGKRSASFVAASTSVARPGAGGRSRRASAGADATTTRLPERRGTRGTRGFNQCSSRLSTDCSGRVEVGRCANGRRGALPARGADPAGGDRRRNRGGDRRRRSRLRGGSLRRADADAHGPGAAGRDAGDAFEGFPAGGRRCAHVRPVRVRRLSRDAGPRRSRPRRACAEDGRPEPHGAAAHTHHRPRSRRVGEPEAALHAGLGRGDLEDAGHRPRRLPPGRPAARSPTRSRSRFRRAREPPSPAPRSTSATAASTVMARTGSAACRIRSRPTRRSPSSRARASGTSSTPTRRSRP